MKRFSIVIKCIMTKSVVVAQNVVVFVIAYVIVVVAAASIIVTAADDAAASDKVQVNVYEGPTECDDNKRVTEFDTLGMHYVGTIDESSKTGTTGFQFDSSRDRDIVLDVTIGFGGLIDGWEIGLIGLCQGAKAIMIVPPEFAYGLDGVGDIIPVEATLRFDVEIVSVTKPLPHPNLFDELDSNGDDVLTPDEIVVHFRKEGPNVELPPDLMNNEDKNNDGVVSREEFGGPDWSYEMCLKMLHQYSEPNQLGLSLQWLCYRPRSTSDSSSDLEQQQQSQEDDEQNDDENEKGKHEEL